MNELLVQEYRAGSLGINKLAKKFGISSWLVTKILRQAGVQIATPSRMVVSDERLLTLAETTHDAEIARIVGLSKHVVSKRLRGLGIKARLTTDTNRLYPLNVGDLARFDQEFGAYWFGFLLADGYIATTRPRLNCNLQFRDFRHLSMLCGDLQTSRFPRKRFVTTNGVKFPRASLTIDSRALCDSYRAAGWDEFKAGNPNLLPSNLNLKHFLRGFWDGDGIVTNSHSYLRMGLVSPHLPIIEWATAALHGIYSGVPQKVGIHNGCFYRFWGPGSSVRIARYLYTDQTRALARKITKIMPYL